MFVFFLICSFGAIFCIFACGRSSQLSKREEYFEKSLCCEK